MGPDCWAGQVAEAWVGPNLMGLEGIVWQFMVGKVIEEDGVVKGGIHIDDVLW